MPSHSWTAVSLMQPKSPSASGSMTTTAGRVPTAAANVAIQVR